MTPKADRNCMSKIKVNGKRVWEKLNFHEWLAGDCVNFQRLLKEKSNKLFPLGFLEQTFKIND